MSPKLSLGLILAWLPGLVLGSTLRLECLVQDERLPFAGLENGSLLVRRGAETVPAPQSATWVIAGKIQENRDVVRWAPRHKLEVQALTEHNGFQEIRKAEVSADPVDGAGADKSSLSDWPGVKTDGCALVAVWLIKGEASKVQVRPLKAAGSEALAKRYSFLLSPEEAEGQPVLLLWSNGDFVRPEPEFSDESTQQAFVATLGDNVAGLKSALATGAKLKKKSRTGASLAHYAAMANAAGTLQFLLQQYPALANAKDKFDDDTPLRWAALTGRLATLQVLLKSGVAPAGRGSGSGPLGAAVFAGQTEVVRLLLQAGAPPQSEHASIPLSDAISFGYTEMAEILLKNGGTHNFKSAGTEWNLVGSAAAGRESMVRFLLAHGVNPNSTEFVPGPINYTVTVQTPGGAVEVPPEPAPSKPPESGVTALMKAAESNSVRTATALLEHGANPNLKTSEGVTALHLAADANAVAMVRLLLTQRADLAVRSKAGLSPLDVALLDNASDAAQALAQAGSRIDLHADNTAKLLECALREDVADAIANALTAGWSPNAKIGPVYPALFLARYFGAKTCEQALLGAGAVETDRQALPLVRLSDLDVPLKPVKSPMPGNLHLASRETVRVEFLLTPEGQPRFIHLIDAVDRSLATATLHALEDWRFNPPVKAGRPVSVRVAMPIVYKAGREHASDDLSLGVPLILRTARPDYPLALASGKPFGRVWVVLLVKADGSYTDVKIDSSTDPVFEPAALQAIKGYRFGPRLVGGQPVDARLMFPVDFIPPG